MYRKRIMYSGLTESWKLLKLKVNHYLPCDSLKESLKLLSSLTDFDKMIQI